jgi:hypothetical protein
MTFYTYNKLGRIDSTHFYANPVFLVENNTDTAFRFARYGKWKENIGILTNPTYSRIEKRNGTWGKIINYGWCGNGLTGDTLFAGEKRLVEFRPDKKEDVDAVKFILRLYPLNSTRWRHLESDEIKLVNIVEATNN